MFICNFKVNSNFWLKALLTMLLLIVLSIVIFSIYKLFSNSSFTVNDDIDHSQVYCLTSENYTNVLKAVHDNLDDYIGQQISFSGYVYRAYDFDNTQFVLARNMVISSDFQTLIVGFLCHLDSASSYPDGTWVNITGTITKGNYHGEIPIIEIKNIQKIEKPQDEYVYPPDDDFVATSTIL